MIRPALFTTALLSFGCSGTGGPAQASPTPANTEGETAVEIPVLIEWVTTASQEYTLYINGRASGTGFPASRPFRVELRPGSYEVQIRLGRTSERRYVHCTTVIVILESDSRACFKCGRGSGDLRRVECDEEQVENWATRRPSPERATRGARTPPPGVPSIL